MLKYLYLNSPRGEPELYVEELYSVFVWRQTVTANPQEASARDLYLGLEVIYWKDSIAIASG